MFTLLVTKTNLFRIIFIINEENMMEKFTIILAFWVLAITNINAKDQWFDDDFFDEMTDEDYIQMFSFSLAKPYIDLNIGLNKINIDSKIYSNNFNEIGALNGKFGFSRKKSIFDSNSIYKGSNNYLYIDYLNKDLPLSKTNALNNNAKIFQIGFGDDDSYSYRIADVVDLEFTNNSAYGWTWMSFDNIDTDTNNIKYLNYISDGMRFSNSVGNDIKVSLNDSYGISAGFSRTIVYQRHLFWYWAGSEIINGAGSGMIDWFVRSIARRSSGAAPIVYFVLHSAYNYGMYELRKEKMNWPIETSPGYIYDNFKVGISVKF